MDSSLVNILKKQGRAKNKPDSDFDSLELNVGTLIELEHVNDKSVSKEIAKDHLVENKEYYKDDIFKDEREKALKTLGKKVEKYDKVKIDDVINFLKDNPYPKDECLHKWAEENNYDKQQVEKLAYKLATKYVVKNNLKKSTEQLLKALSKPQKKAMKHSNKLGAKKRKGLKGKSKFKVVMQEFARGTLHSSDGKIVIDRNQALAIAYSESGLKKSQTTLLDFIHKNVFFLDKAEEVFKIPQEELQLLKSKKLPIGHITTLRSGMKVKKLAEGKWVPIRDEKLDFNISNLSKDNIKEMQSDTLLRNQFVMDNQAYISQIIGKHRMSLMNWDTKKVDYPAMYQEGNVGFIQAIKRYDADKYGAGAFSTYLWKYIQGHMMRAANKESMFQQRNIKDLDTEVVGTKDDAKKVSKIDTISKQYEPSEEEVKRGQSKVEAFIEKLKSEVTNENAKKVIDLMTKVKSRAEIARQLGMDLHTVLYYLKQIKKVGERYKHMFQKSDAFSFVKSFFNKVDLLIVDNLKPSDYVAILAKARKLSEGEEVTYNLKDGSQRVFKKVNGKLKFVRQIGKKGTTVGKQSEEVKVNLDEKTKRMQKVDKQIQLLKEQLNHQKTVTGNPEYLKPFEEAISKLETYKTESSEEKIASSIKVKRMKKIARQKAINELKKMNRELKGV